MKLASHFLVSLCVLLAGTIFVAGTETDIGNYGYTVLNEHASCSSVHISLGSRPVPFYRQQRSLEDDVNYLVTGPEPVFVFFAFENRPSSTSFELLTLLGIKEGVRIFNTTEHDVALSVDDRPVEIINTQPLFSFSEGGLYLFKESMRNIVSRLNIIIYSPVQNLRASLWDQFRVTRVSGMGIIATGCPFMLVTDLFNTSGTVRTMVLHTSDFPALQVYMFDESKYPFVRRIVVLAEGSDAVVQLQLRNTFETMVASPHPKEVHVLSSPVSSPFDFDAFLEHCASSLEDRSRYELRRTRYELSQLESENDVLLNVMDMPFSWSK